MIGFSNVYVHVSHFELRIIALYDCAVAVGAVVAVFWFFFHHPPTDG